MLSLVLRHKPGKIGLELDKNGWADTQELLQKLAPKGFRIDLETLKKVVAENDKQRFKLNQDFSKIRANQGHSISIELELPPTVPPDYLYHGTASKNIQSILAEGIQKRSRQHVHLSLDLETATKVGQRHGTPTILIVDAMAMHKDGIEFFVSENQVWLTDFIDPKYISTVQ